MHRKRVALAIPYNREILRGIGQYLTTHERWRIDWVDNWAMSILPKQWRDWPGDGAIIQMLTPEVQANSSDGRRPVVNVSDGACEAIPTVQSDNKAIGALGAEHFLERGFRNLAFCGDMRADYAQLRWEGFAATGKKADAHVTLLDSIQADVLDMDPARKHLAEQLAELDKPVGVMCGNDIQAHIVARTCLEAEALVPEQVAILGVDNDELTCDLDCVPLSSVIPDRARIGYLAAEMLDKMMRGKTPRKTHIQVPPAGIAERRSTDILAVGDEDVVAALNTIRSNISGDLSPMDLARQVGLSRRSLDRKFMATIHRTVAEEILLRRLQLARELLRQTRLQMAEVAERTGFTSINHFGQCFRRRYGQSPSNYRKQFAES